MSLEKEDISEHINNLLITWEGSKTAEFVPSTETRIRVNEVVSKLAFLYEKVRNTIDFKEEHLLRKAAIERILKMRILREKKGSAIAKSLLQELIRAGYLLNNHVPETKIAEVAFILDKHIFLMQALASSGAEPRFLRNTYEWIMGIAACEIEQKIVPAIDDHAMAATMYRVVLDNLVVKKGNLSDEEKEILLYIATYKTLLKYDQGWLEYFLWRLYVPDWDNMTPEMVQELAGHIFGIRQGITRYLKHKRLDSFFRLCRKYTVLFLVIRDMYKKDEHRIYEILGNPTLLEEAVRESCRAKYREARKKLRRSAVRSILYILITKMALAFLVEVPYDLYVADVINRMTLTINIVFPPLLMFFAALLIRVPSESNTIKIIQGIRSIVYRDQHQQIPLLLRRLDRSLFLTVVFGFLYAFMFLFSFGILIGILRSLTFNMLSISLFIFFLCVVSFFAFHIRRSAREMVIESQKERFRTVVADFLSLPFLRAGRFLSETLSKVNVFMFIFDFFFEAPFKSFVEISEEFLGFLKEKKDEV